MTEPQDRGTPQEDDKAIKPPPGSIGAEAGEVSRILGNVLALRFPDPSDRFGCMLDMLARMLVENSTDLVGMRSNLAELVRSVTECCEANWPHEEILRQRRQEAWDLERMRANDAPVQG